MDKPNTTIILSSIALGALFAWLMEYTEWWQWLLSIIVTGIIIYCAVGLFMLLASVIAGIVLLRYWENHKKEIKFKLWVMWEWLWRPFSSREEIENFVHEKYNL